MRPSPEVLFVLLEAVGLLMDPLSHVLQLAQLVVRPLLQRHRAHLNRVGGGLCCHAGCLLWRLSSCVPAILDCKAYPKPTALWHVPFGQWEGALDRSIAGQAPESTAKKAFDFNSTVDSRRLSTLVVNHSAHGISNLLPNLFPPACRQTATWLADSRLRGLLGGCSCCATTERALLR